MIVSLNEANSELPAGAFGLNSNDFAPSGIESLVVSAHLDDIERNVRLIAPEAAVVGRAVVTA